MYSSWSCNLGGRDNFINSSASYATILGGFGNRCDGPGTQAGGIQSLAKTAGVRAFAAGQFSEAEGVPGYSFGSQQVTDAVLRGETPGIAANETVYLKAGTFFGDPTDSLVPQNDKTYFIETNVVARKTDGTSKVFINRTLASYVGSTPTFVGSNDNSQAIEIGSPNVLWDIAITEGEGTIDVAFSTGSGVTEKVRVVAHVKMTEVFSAEPI